MVLPGQQLRELALFAGGGGGLLGGLIVGWRTRCAVEIDVDARNTLLRRQRDCVLPRFPIWDDIRTFDGKQWRGAIDVVSGGFPCTDISAAGTRKGLAGENSGLWFEMLRVIGEVRPRFVFAENSPHLRTRGLGTVLKGLAGLGYNARWCVLGARDVGANHLRYRMWIVAHSDNPGKRTIPFPSKMASTSEVDGVAPESTNTSLQREGQGDMSGGVETQDTDAQSAARPGDKKGNSSDAERSTIWQQQGRWIWKNRENKTVVRITDWWDIPRFARVDDGGSNRLDFESSIAEMEMEGVAEKPRDRNARIVQTGNMQVPAVAALVWTVLTCDLGV